MATYQPEDAVTQKEDGALVEWSVSPNSSETLVPSGYNEWRGCWEARLREPARNGRANQELLETLEELLGADARIESGAASSRKSVWVGCSPDRVVRVLKQESQE